MFFSWHSGLPFSNDCRLHQYFAQSAISLPTGMPEWLTPLVGIVAGQLFACHLTVVKGYDPEKPRTISKVTETH